MAYGWRGEGLSSEGEPERMSGRADSIGRTYQDDSERSSRRKANEAETGWSQPAHKLQTRPPGKGRRCAKFLCRIWYLCWNLTIVKFPKVHFHKLDQQRLPGWQSFPSSRNEPEPFQQLTARAVVPVGFS